MTFIQTPPAADGALNLATAFSHRPELFAAWQALIAAVREPMDPRRYELVTLAAARRLRSSYCALAHGEILAEQHVGAETVRALMADPGSAGLGELDLAIFELADKVAADATAVERADVERLKALGLTDAEVFDVVAAAAARCFFSTLLDGVGAEPDARYAELEASLRDALTVGRPIAAG